MINCKTDLKESGKKYRNNETTYERAEEKETVPPTYEPNFQKLYTKTAVLIHKEGLKFKKSIAKIYLISHVIGKIQSNKCYHHSYLVFYIPAILMIAQQLGEYQNEKFLDSYHLFTFLIKRVIEISKEVPKQLENDDIPNYLTIAISYHKTPEKVEQTFKEFLQKKEQRMKGFLPIYYLYFKMIADQQKLFGEQHTIEKAKSIIAQVQQQFDKYRSKQL